MLPVTSERRQILSVGARLSMLYSTEQRLDQQWETVEGETIKLILKLRTKIPNFKVIVKILN